MRDLQELMLKPASQMRRAVSRAIFDLKDKGRYGSSPEVLVPPAANGFDIHAYGIPTPLFGNIIAMGAS